MSPVAQAICNVLLSHHRDVCTSHRHRAVIVDRCVITYGELCRRAGCPDIAHGVGPHLQEVAEWCSVNGWPPLNSLAVNQESRMPGDGYDGAPGCNLNAWPTEAEACIVFDGYPEEIQ